jgi:cytochrome P450
MLLRICEHKAVVVSSAEVAREMFMGRGTSLEQRPTSPGMDDVYSGHGTMGIIFAPYGEYWRQLRRVIMAELLSTRRVQSFGQIRQEEAARLVSSLASSPPGQLVNIDELLAGFVADSSVRAIFGDGLLNRAAFLEMMKHGTDISSLFDLRDLFPSSRLVRMLPRSCKQERHRKEISRLMDDILQEHKKRREEAAQGGGGEQERDMIGVLLRLQNEGCMEISLTPGVIKVLVMVRYSLPYTPSVL